MEEIFVQQKKICDNIIKLYTNIRKDSSDRKTIDYFKKRLETLEGLWNDYQYNHDRLSTEASRTDDYFVNQEYEYTKKHYYEVKNLINGQYQSLLESLRRAEEQAGAPVAVVGKKQEREISQDQDLAAASTSQLKTSQQRESGGFSKLDDLLKKQNINFLAFKRTVKNIDIEDISESWEMQDALRDLGLRWSNIDNLHWEIQGELEGEDSEYERIFDSHERTYNTLKKQINSKMWSVAHREKTLPQLEIPTFYGTYNTWVSFKDLFNEAINNNPSISKAQKMQFLKAKVRGEAEKLIQHLNISSDNYSVCWEILTNRYNNKKLIFGSHINVLLGLPNMTRQSLEQLKGMHDTTLECLHAIKNLGVDTLTWDPLLVHILSEKLDKESYSEYIESLKNSKDLPVLQEFLKYLESKFTILESSRRKNEQNNIFNTKINQPNTSMPFQHNKTPTYQHNKTFNNRPFYSNITHKSNHISKIICPLCSQEHGIYNCKRFLEMTNEAKLQTIKHLRICSNCLFSHNDKKCTSIKRCRKCNGAHSTLIHDAIAKPNTSWQLQGPMPSTSGITLPKPNFKQNDQVNTTFSSNKKNDLCETLLATALIKVTNQDGSQVTLRALIDQGSQLSLVTEHAVQMLGLKRERCKAVIFGVGQKSNNCKGVVTLVCRSMYHDFEFNVEALVMNNLIKNLPNKTFQQPSWSYIQNINLADPQFNNSRPVDLLLGANIYSLIMMGGMIKGKCVSQPIAQQTYLGWILCGGSVRSYQCNVVLNNIEQIQSFWEIEDITDEQSLTVEEQHCIQYYNTTTTRRIDGSYEVRIPLKPEIQTQLGTSRTTAVTQFYNLEKKLNRQKDLAIKYKTFIQEYEQLGHMIPAIETNSGLQCYLPHHAVERAESTTTKTRVVFNASCKTSSGYSLNDVMYTGPNLQHDLQNLILKWRQFRYAFTADIEKMYRKIWLHSQDQQLQKIVWRENSNLPLASFQLTTVTYGTRSAPYLAMMTLKRLAHDEKLKYAEASKVVEESFYMDDLIHGSHCIEHCKQLVAELYDLLKSGGFTLRKWSTNNPNILKNIEQQDNINKIFQFKSEHTSKTLGLGWSPTEDTFYFNCNIAHNIPKLTKRALLSEISKLYDPLGWIAPITTKLKILFQKIWQENIGWDDLVPNNIASEWEKVRNDLDIICEFKIPRWLGTQQSDVIELHGFCDASQHAYGCVVHARISRKSSVQITLVAAKTKLVPTNKTNITLPRLELSGAAHLAKLITKIKQSLCNYNIETYGWCDSMVVLGWLHGEPSRWKPFVANRVQQITSVMPSSCWRYIASQENPADAASRGLYASQLKDHPLWWQGPAWLANFDSKTQQFKTYETREEIKNKLTNVIQTNIQTNINIIDTLLNNCSSVTKVKRIIAWILRARLSKSERKQLPTYLTLNELRNATTKIIKHVQRCQFNDDINYLTKHNSKMHSKSKLLNLNPFIDQQGILRVGGRIKNATLNSNMKFPAIIPHDSRLTTLLIEQAHQLTFHGGARLTLANLRQQYWVVGGNNATKKHIRKCVICRKCDTQKQNQLMADLPEPRTNPASPFYHTGVDYSGFVNIKLNKGRGVTTCKGYIALFVCLVTKAVHLELVSDLSSSAFLCALRRMAARRGTPGHIYSDNGTNFKGCNRVLQEEITEIQGSLQNDCFLADITELNIEWHWNAPSWPSAGGLWERAMRSLKHHLKRVVGENKLTFEEFTTILAEIEACLNSRPLCALSEDVEDLDFLTPAHFLTGRSGLTVIQTPEDARTRWHVARKIFKDLWKRWNNEYLVQQSVRNKWRIPRENIKVGDMVMIQDDNIQVGKWAVGRVVELHPGNDGLVRVVTLRTKNGELKRPVVKLSLLPVRQNTESLADNAEQQTKHSTPTKTKRSTFSSIFMALVYLMTLLTNCTATYNITKLTTGSPFFFDQLAKMHLIRDEWKIIIYYHMEPYWDGVIAYNKLIEHLDNTCHFVTSETLKHHCSMIISQQKHEFAELQYYDKELLSQHFSGHARQRRRRRRGLINAVGNIANSLFGVLDSEFAEQYTKEIKHIRYGQQQLYNLWKNQTSLIESEFNLIKRTKEVMQKQYTNIHKYLNLLDVSRKIILANLSDINLQQEFIMSAMTASNLLQSLKQIQETLLDTITDIYQGQVSIHLLTPEQLQSELNIISGQLAEDLTLPIDNVHKNLPSFYKLLRIKTRMTEDYLFFEVRFPLISRDYYKLFRLIPIPKQVGNNMIKVLPISNNIAINLQKDSYLTVTEKDLTFCIPQQTNLLCEIRTPIYHLSGDDHMCVTDPITNSCQTEKTACLDQWESLNDLSTYMYFSCNTYTIKVICEDHITTESLTETGLITLSNNCMIKGKGFTLHSHSLRYEHTIKIGANNIVIPNTKIDQINYLFKLNITDELKDEQNESDIYYIDNKLDEMQKHIESLKQVNLNSELSYRDEHHYSAIYALAGMLVGVLLVLALFALLVWRRRRGLLRRVVITPDLELQSVSECLTNAATRQNQNSVNKQCVDNLSIQPRSSGQSDNINIPIIKTVCNKSCSPIATQKRL